MIGKRTIFFLLLGIMALFMFAVFFFGDGSTNAQQYNIKNSSNEPDILLANKNTTPQPTPTAIATPVPPIKIVVSSLPPEPTMREIPDISINGPDNIKTGDTFVLEFEIDTKTEKIAGLSAEINFDGKLIEAKNVDIFDPNTGQYPNLEKGSYIKGDITDEGIMNIAIAKEKGENIVGNFMNVEFKATRQGEAKITAQITAVNEESAYKEIRGVSKTIRIV